MRSCLSICLCLILDIILYFIGKTASLNLLLYRAAMLNADVIVHNARSNTLFLLRKDGTVDFHFILGDHPAKVRELLNSSSTLYLFNPDEKDTQALESSAFTVIATSPDEKHYSDSRKLSGMEVYFLAPWTLEEARHANRALPPHLRQDESILEERFEHVGGSVRLLLSFENLYISNVTKITNALENLTFDELKRWYSLIKHEKSIGGDLEKIKAPHYIFHCEPDNKTRGITCILRFATENTKALILNHIQIGTEDDWTSLLDFMRKVDSSRSSLGWKYEETFHAKMRNYSKFSNKFHVLKNKKEVNNEDFGLEVDSVLEETPVYKRSANPEEDVANALAASECT